MTYMTEATMPVSSAQTAVQQAIPRSVQRSFRLSATTADLLDRQAARAGESRNALADRLLTEGLRREIHPLVTFRSGAAGRREPHVGVSRLKVREFVSTLLASGGDFADAATTFDLPASEIEAAASYYADFAPEIDSDIAWAETVAEEERQRWEREQSAFT